MKNDTEDIVLLLVYKRIRKLRWKHLQQWNLDHGGFDWNRHLDKNSGEILELQLLEDYCADKRLQSGTDKRSIINQ